MFSNPAAVKPLNRMSDVEQESKEEIVKRNSCWTVSTTQRGRERTQV